MERDALDLRFRLRGKEQPGPEVVILAFDDKTLENAPFLFERRVGQARVMSRAVEEGARVLGLDLFFADPERLLDEDLIKDVDAYLTGQPEGDAADPVAYKLLARVEEEVHGDEQLAQTIKRLRNVVLSFHVGDRGNVAADDRYLSRGKYGQVSAGDLLPQKNAHVMASESQFNRVAARLGVLSTFEDMTGCVRDVPVGLRLGPSVFAPLGVQLVAEYEGVSRAAVALIGSEGSIHIGDRVVQSYNGHLLLNYRGSFPTYSVVDLVDGHLPPDALKDKIALIGYTNLAQDTVKTPFGRRPGVEVHATVVDNILRGDSLRRTTPLVDFFFALLPGLLVCVLFFRRLPATVQILGSLTVFCGAIGVAHFLFVSADMWIALVGPLIVGGATSAVCLAGAYLQEGLQRRYLRSTFAHYLSDELVEELVADPSRVSLKGERRDLTVLFSDIRNFTNFSEKLSPEELANFLNAYFTPMTRAVMYNGGYVDKFIGDALMAIFGAPVANTKHANHACQSALDMFAALDGIRPLAERHDIELAIGCGINTGEMVVGNMGSHVRFDYTVLGDAVNFASRVEGLTKKYGVFCLVGEQTTKEAMGFNFRPVDWVRVKGKSKPVAIFELCSGPKSTISEYLHVEVYEEALGAYRQGDFELARAKFREFLVHNPHDNVTSLFLDRLEHVPEPPPNWDGVFVFTVK
ncbi:MAG: adenylate/guanylate cyclase domain-containing protein, partial [Proteobacteria bacterium]|nr:adenylate/guanylate cyclase domain-containing protein [Pseudomonadota bacterium]